MSQPIRLTEIDGDLVQQTGAVTKLWANWGTFDQKKNELELYERINIDGSSGMKARLTRATVHTKDNRVISSEPVVADLPTGSVKARTMDLDAKSRRVAFQGAVEVRMKPAKATPVEEAKTPRSAALPGLSVNSNVPVDVFSERLDVDDNTKIAEFRGSVVARQADAALTAPELDVIYEGRAALPTGATPNGAADTGTRIQRLKARGGVTMTQKDDSASSETLDYEAAGEHIVLRGNVVLTSTNDRRITTATAEFYGASDTALLTGDVVVVQGKNILRGQRLALDRKAGKTRLDSPADAGRGAGRIAATFYQPDRMGTPAQGSGAKPDSKADASAMAMPLGTAFKTDPKAPIDVDADSLDVLDQSKIAVFKGGVVAKQGEFLIRSSELTVRYSGQAGLELSPAKSEGAQSAQVTKIEARHKVTITSGDGRTATGDWADFDIKSNMAVLGGKVVVIQGKNVVEGTKLVIDMNTGQSKFETAAPKNAPLAEAGAPSAPKVEGCAEGQVCTKNRVRAVFYPKDMSDAQKKKKSEDPNGALDRGGSSQSRQPASSSWQSTLQPGAE